MLRGIQNFLEFIVEHWTEVFIIICCIVLIVERVKAYFKKSKEERIAIAKTQVSQLILKWVCDAEEDYAEWSKAGSIKRSQVIQQVYESFPILEQVLDQDTLVEWIDATIDEALKTVREIVKINSVVEPEASE